MEKKKPLIEEVKSIGSVLLMAAVIRIFIFEPFFVPTGSMQDNLMIGDYVFATKYNYGYSKHSFLINNNLFNGRFLESKPDRGDIIIFRPPHNMEMRYVKRLIGLPGDKVQLKESVVYINGTEVPREFKGGYIDEQGTEYFRYIETLPNGLQYNILQQPGKIPSDYRGVNSTVEFTVPEGEYFFLGDNRDGSLDSRLNLGTVPSENFIAKGRFIYFSASELMWDLNLSFTEQLKQIGKWFTSIRLKRLLHNIYNMDNYGSENFTE